MVNLKFNRIINLKIRFEFYIRSNITNKIEKYNFLITNFKFNFFMF